MLFNREEIIAAGSISPEISKALEKIKKPEVPIDGDPLSGLRAWFSSIEQEVADRIGPPPSTVQELYHKIPMRDGFASSLKIHKPSTPSHGPLVVLCFGGAFSLGSNEQLSDVARALVMTLQATVVQISYRLAPEHKFPTAQYDSIDSVKWIAANAESDLLASDPNKGFVIGGVSAGGALSACLTRYFQKESLAHRLTGQWLAIPSVMHGDIVPEEYKSTFSSRKDNAEAPFLTADAIEYGLQITAADIHSELRYAINSTTPLQDQPKTYFQTCGLDPLRDDSLIYEDMLKNAGVATKLDFYPGAPHGFWQILAGIPYRNKALIDSLQGIAWLLDRNVSRQEAAQALHVGVA